MSDFSEVERPLRKRFGMRVAINQAVLATADTGKAVRIVLDGTMPYTIRNRLYSSARIRGLLLHIKQDGPDHLIAWCEHRRAVEPAPEGSAT